MTAPAPPRRKGFLWVIPLVLVIGGTVLAGIGIVVLVFRIFVFPIVAAEDYLEQLERRDYRAAYALLCPDRRAIQSEASYLAQQAVTERTFGPVTYSEVDTIKIEDGRMLVVADVERRRSGFASEVRVVMSRDDGDWRVCRLSDEGAVTGDGA